MQERGRNWQTVVFAEQTTGAVRFTETKVNPTGHFAVLVWSLQSQEAQKIFELSGNKAAYKHRIKIPEGTTGVVGFMKDSDIPQFYFEDVNSLMFYDSTKTDGDS